MLGIPILGRLRELGLILLCLVRIVLGTLHKLRVLFLIQRELGFKRLNVPFVPF
jgi:hypothetical protein